MKTEDALRLLLGHQARILAQVDASCALLTVGPDAACAGLARARWTLSRLLREYQLFKQGEVFGPAIARGTPEQAALARRMKANCVAAGEHYALHVSRWSARDVAGHWDDYRAAVLAITADVRAHLARERRDLERFLSGSARTRRLAPTVS